MVALMIYGVEMQISVSVWIMIIKIYGSCAVFNIFTVIQTRLSVNGLRMSPSQLCSQIFSQNHLAVICLRHEMVPLMIYGLEMYLSVSV